MGATFRPTTNDRIRRRSFSLRGRQSRSLPFLSPQGEIGRPGTPAGFVSSSRPFVSPTDLRASHKEGARQRTPFSRTSGLHLRPSRRASSPPQRGGLPSISLTNSHLRDRGRGSFGPSRARESLLQIKEKRNFTKGKRSETTAACAGRRCGMKQEIIRNIA